MFNELKWEVVVCFVDIGGIIESLFKLFHKEHIIQLILTWRSSFALQTNEQFIDGIISFAHVPVNVTDFSIGSVVCDIFRKRKYKLPTTVFVLLDISESK